MSTCQYLKETKLNKQISKTLQTHFTKARTEPRFGCKCRNSIRLEIRMRDASIKIAIALAKYQHNIKPGICLPLRKSH